MTRKTRRRLGYLCIAPAVIAFFGLLGAIAVMTWPWGPLAAGITLSGFYGASLLEDDYV